MIKRLSVAVLAPDWSVGAENYKVGIMNKASLARGRRSASAFGGALALTSSEMAFVKSLGGIPEREGSLDARLLVEEYKLQDLLQWFRIISKKRLEQDLIREIEEEALFEGAPVFDPESLQELTLHFDRLDEIVLNPSEIRSKAAEGTETSYLWFIFRVCCSERVLEQLKASARIVMPSADEIAERRCGDVVLSATLV